MIVHVQKTFIALSCKMCGKYAKNKSKIRRHWTKCHVFCFGDVPIDFDISDISQT